MATRLPCSWMDGRGATAIDATANRLQRNASSSSSFSSGVAPAILNQRPFLTLAQSSDIRHLLNYHIFREFGEGGEQEGSWRWGKGEWLNGLTLSLTKEDLRTVFRAERLPSQQAAASLHLASHICKLTLESNKQRWLIASHKATHAPGREIGVSKAISAFCYTTAPKSNTSRRRERDALIPLIHEARPWERSKARLWGMKSRFSSSTTFTQGMDSYHTLISPLSKGLEFEITSQHHYRRHLCILFFF